MKDFLTRRAALEAQLDAVFDDTIARLLAMVAECPKRQYRAGDHHE